ncbi:MAG TPA: TIGR00303 family protein [Chloroflexota bacterium]|nr:TIGR00303 family protein [Chloroflexota bacterium]
MRAPILFAAAPEPGRAFVERWRGFRPSFWCVLAHTDTCLVPGLSAAGASEELRPLTPAADAEVVNLGAPRCLPRLPSNPLGAAGPAGITRAALAMAGVDAMFVGAGLRVWPATECRRISCEPGGNIERGCAVRGAAELFELGQQLGRECRERYLVLGESVPGGTTTALALLLALGYAAEGRVSGSQAGNGHALKIRVARSALNATGWAPGDGRADPLTAVCNVGDPMQPLAAGVVLGATQAGCDVLLAGGSQMLAVAALLQALRGSQALERVAIGTTRWVVEDPAADVPGLAAEISGHLAVLAANLDFSASRHDALRAYEGFLVKEGVGAGGASIAALLHTGQPIEQLEAAIDATYDGLLGRLNAPV